MPVVETYAKRKSERARAGQPDIYGYDVVPTFLRQQVQLILEASLGVWSNNTAYWPGVTPNGLWSHLADLMEREFESFPGRVANGQRRLSEFLSVAGDVDEWLSAVELCCRLLDNLADDREGRESLGAFGVTQPPEEAIEEINIRFREHAFGYEYRNREIIRIDDQFVHAEIVKPVLAVLTDIGFEKANEDFMTAHRHYREGSTKDAIVAANRAFESTLKAICMARGWEYPKGARAGELVTAVRNAGLFPAHLGNGLDTYIALMKTGLPAVRNNAGGHGEDPGAPSVPDYLAAYAIHLTASNILLAAKAHSALGS